ncbi:MAG: exo-alpha-sialidase [Cyclobacteriaceae bacterium]
MHFLLENIVKLKAESVKLVLWLSLYFTLSAFNPTTTHEVGSGATNIIFQSKDGGQTWLDISQSLPENEQPEGFFAGESDLYLRVNEIMYHSKSNLKTPVWEKETGLDPRSNSIAFNRSGVMAYNYEGQVYQKMSAAGWLPVYTNFNKQTLRTVFETSDGTVFLGRENGLYKSGDRGQSWKQVKNGGWVMDMVESEGVLIATGQGGIMRSTDNGEHWESVINEGGVGIAVERIDGGFAAISYNTKTKSRRIRLSMDSGKTWQAIDAGLPPSASISSIKQIGKYLICGHPDGIFRSADMGKTWSLVHPSVDNAFMLTVNRNTVPFSDNRKVFKIYVSGYVVYAVARDSGC